MAGCSNNPSGTSASPEATGSVPSSAEPSALPSESAASESQFPAAGSKMVLTYAKNFSIEYLEDGMKLVTDGQGVQFLLLQEGQTAPSQYASLKSLTIPISKVIYTSTTQVGYLRAFEDDSLFDSIVGVRATADTWDFDAMKSRMVSGKIVDIGSNTSMSTSYDYEIIQSLTPSVVFTNKGMSSEQTDLMTMLDQAGITYIFDGSAAEADYRGTMEWVKFYAAFYNLEKEAAAYFNTAMDKIDNIIAVTSQIPDDQKVTVGWGIVTGGKIYVENGGSKSAQMIRDCGGKYIFDDIGAGKDGVTELTAEEFYSRMSQADLFVNRGMPKYGPDIDGIIEQFPTLADIPCLKEGKVLQITDSFWNSYHNIDGKYVEMSEFFYPDTFNNITNDQFTHFLIMPQTAG
jgi:iron complex transport system substrate-binding protein